MKGKDQDSSPRVRTRRIAGAAPSQDDGILRVSNRLTTCDHTITFKPLIFQVALHGTFSERGSSIPVSGILIRVACPVQLHYQGSEIRATASKACAPEKGPINSTYPGDGYSLMHNGKCPPKEHRVTPEKLFYVFSDYRAVLRFEQHLHGPMSRCGICV